MTLHYRSHPYARKRYRQKEKFYQKVVKKKPWLGHGPLAKRRYIGEK